jgi:hypothetical protein
LIRKKANLSASGDTNLVAYPPRRSLYEVLSNASPDALENSFAESRIRKQFPGLPSRALLQGGMLRMLPYRLSVQ